MRSLCWMILKGGVSALILILPIRSAEAAAPTLNKSDAKAIVTYRHPGCRSPNIAAVVHGLHNETGRGLIPSGGDTAVIFVVCNLKRNLRRIRYIMIMISVGSSHLLVPLPYACAPQKAATITTKAGQERRER